MASRSISATTDGCRKAINARTGKGWNTEDLASKVIIQGKKTTTGIGIATVKKFFNCENVDRKYFVGICAALELDWKGIADFETVEPKTESALPVDTIEILVQTIRQKVNADIHNRCGTMRVLDMEQPLGIGEIYTSVNILEKLSGRQRLGIEELREDGNINNSDRLMLGQVRVERVPGIEAVERYNKLMILGKPGAGKTTFMKRLATQCNQGKFETQRIPVFVTLKEFAEDEGRPDLPSYIAQQWRACDVEKTSLAQVLKHGRALVLLDGLDEVQTTEHDRVLHSIKGFTEQFRDCQCVVTCRIAAREYTFEQFTEVEVADFNQEQIEDFATKWFGSKEDPEKGKNFIKRLQDNQPIQELATNPLLLTLLCLVFGEANDFPKNRSELYKEGLDILLKKWDGKRNIERDQVYKKLSLKRKEDLLSQLAYQTFKQGDYFFKQLVVETKIIDYIRNLSGANENEEALQLDSEAVLKSIEAQHGLLVERAKGIYSFSHLTFQEYFTAKQITSPTSQLSISLENLAQNFGEKRYREVFFLVVGMLPEADDFFRLLKIQVDQLIADEPDLQKFLIWVSGKAQSVKVDYKLEAIRAYYLTRALACARARALTSANTLTFALDLALALTRTLALTCASAFDLAIDLALDLTLVRARTLAIGLDLALARALDQLVKRESQENDDPELTIKLKALQSQLPDPQDIQACSSWWKAKGESWTENLRHIMLDHRNIGHDWQFTPAQTEKLRQYFEANQLLVDCFNSDCYVTKATRQEILSTLLLPMSELEELSDLANE